MRPFTRFLTDVGTPVEKGFRQARLPFYALEDMNNYIPSQRFWTFLVNMAYSQGLEDLGFRVGQMFGANCADPKLTSLLHKSPTLYAGFLQVSSQLNKTASTSQMGQLLSPDSSYTQFYQILSCPADHPAAEQLGWFSLFIFIGIVREFTGPHWQPTEIGLVTHHRPSLYIREQIMDTRICLSQPYCYISFPSALLSLPPIIDTPNTFKLPQYESLSNEFVDSFRKLLRAYVQEDDLSVDFAAELCNMSKRSLQRKLSEIGTRYSEVLDHARFDVARQMLQEPEMKITEIAHRLDYSDQGHFTRFFNRVAGVAPGVYRKQFVNCKG